MLHQRQDKKVEWGIKKGFGKGTNTATPIPPNGVVILGQEQDSVGGKFDVNQAHHGQIADLHLWDHILAPHESTLSYITLI